MALGTRTRQMHETGGRTVPPHNSPAVREPRWRTRSVLLPSGLAAAGGLLLGGLAGGAVGAAPVAGMEQRIADLATANRALTSERDALAKDVDAATEQAEAAVAELEDARAELAGRESAVRRAEEDLAGEQKKFDEAVADRKADSVGQGVFEVGVDVKPGKYRTAGPDGSNSVGCYYAWMASSDAGSRILDNNIVKGPAVVTLKSGQFFENATCQDFIRL